MGHTFSKYTEVSHWFEKLWRESIYFNHLVLYLIFKNVDWVNSVGNLKELWFSDGSKPVSNIFGRYLEVLQDHMHGKFKGR